jgi:hypothetical protein
MNDMHVPFAQKTDLGWAIVGITHVKEEMDDNIGTSHRICAKEVPSALQVYSSSSENIPRVFFVHRAKVKEILDPNRIQTILESDFSDRGQTGTSMSQNDTISKDPI